MNAREKKYFAQLLEKSLQCEDMEDDWIYALIMEFRDDNEGLSDREYFAENWLHYFPLNNEIEFMDEKELEYFENLAFERFKT